MTDEEKIRQFVFLREETRFEINLLHDRVNALIGAEAFLTIAFTSAMANTHPRWGSTFSVVVGPALSIVGIVLALLAWPGVKASFKIIIEWNIRQRQLIRDSPVMVDTMWRPDPPGRKKVRADPNVHRSMIFARSVPFVFVVAWTILGTVAVSLPLLR